MFNIVEQANIGKFLQFINCLGPNTTRQFDNFEGVYTEGTLEGLISSRHNFFGKLDDEIIAYGFLQKSAKKKNVVSLGMVIGDKYQGQGFGKPMYIYVVNYALDNYAKVWSAVYEDNLPALHIHKFLGFQLEGIFIAELNDGRSIYSLAKYRHGFNTRKRYELVEKWDKL